MRGYTQLTQEERYQIYALKKAGHSQTEIATLLERDKSTISRELRRNRGLKGYRPQQAHNLALGRRYDKVQPRIGSQVWQQVEALIREEWSPEQIVGRIAMEQEVSILLGKLRVAPHLYSSCFGRLEKAAMLPQLASSPQAANIAT